MDISGLITEFRIRGFDQRRIDLAMKCLVYVQSVQDLTNAEGGGVLVKDVLDTYPLEVAQVASELYLEKLSMWGLDIFRVKWGYESAARSAARRLWEECSPRWEKFADSLDRRCLGLLLPASYENGSVVESWKTGKTEAEWLGTEVEGLDGRMLSMVNDIIVTGCSFDLAFGYSSFSQRGIDGRWTLLQRAAYDSLKERAVFPPLRLMGEVRLWKFFSQYEPAESDIVQLMKACGLTLDEVRAQVNVFCAMGLTTKYRESQYPPFLVVERAKKAYQQAIGALLDPMKNWIGRRDLISRRSGLDRLSVEGIPTEPRLER